jgi:hypothetical protein
MPRPEVFSARRDAAACAARFRSRLEPTFPPHAASRLNPTCCHTVEGEAEESRIVGCGDLGFLSMTMGLTDMGHLPQPTARYALVSTRLPRASSIASIQVSRSSLSAWTTGTSGSADM